MREKELWSILREGGCNQDTRGGVGITILFFILDLHREKEGEVSNVLSDPSQLIWDGTVFATSRAGQGREESNDL